MAPVPALRLSALAPSTAPVTKMSPAPAPVLTVRLLPKVTLAPNVTSLFVVFNADAADTVTAPE